MGLSIVISGSIMIITLLVTSFTTFRLVTDTSLIEALDDNIVLYDEISNTNIKITSIEAADCLDLIIINDCNNLVVCTDLIIMSCDLLIIKLNNTGTTKLWNYKYFDLIVTYDANITNNKVRVTEYLKYSTRLIDDTWVISSITNDVTDPDILNPDEEMIIHAKLSYPIYANGKLIVSISTNNGVTYTTGKVMQ